MRLIRMRGNEKRSSWRLEIEQGSQNEIIYLYKKLFSKKLRLTLNQNCEKKILKLAMLPKKGYRIKLNKKCLSLGLLDDKKQKWVCPKILIFMFW